MYRERIDFGAAVDRARSTIGQWCPGYLAGKTQGRNRVFLSPIRADKHAGSFSVNEATGEWYDHATGEGGDALSLYAKVKGVRNGEAAAEILGQAYYDEAEEEYIFYTDPQLRDNIAASITDPNLKAEYLKITTPPVEATPKGRDLWPISRYGDFPITPPKWLIKGLLEDDSLALIFGASGSGKSYLAIDMAISIASGRSFHGHKVREPYAVLYIAGEGFKGIGKRMRAYEIKHGISLLGKPLFVSHKAAALRDEEVMQLVRGKVTEIMQQGYRLGLIIIDTWARNMDGNENDSTETSQAIRVVDDLRSMTECTALIIHHSGQAESERARGSSALRAALDVEYKVELNRDKALITLTNTKMKDGEPPDPMVFSFESIDLDIEDEDGDPTYSSVIELIDMSTLLDTQGTKKKGIIQTRMEKTIRDNGGSIEKRALKEQLSDVKERSFYNALKSLVKSSTIIEDNFTVWLNVEKS